MRVARYMDEKRAKAIKQAALFAETNGAKGAPQCPRCGAEMTLEMAPSGSRFWGCTEYRNGQRGSSQPAQQTAAFH